MRARFIFVLSVLFGCCFTDQKATEQPLQGLWSFVSSNGLYWERVFIDSTFWSYSEEFGHQKHKFLIRNDSVMAQYADGSCELKFMIAHINNDSLSIFGEGWKGSYVRLRNPYDFKRIIAGDTVLEWEYIKDYMKRKEEWESAHPPK